MPTDASADTPMAIHPATRIGKVALLVANLDSQVEFYTHVVGLTLNWRADGRAGLGPPGTDLVRLEERSSLRRYRGVTGLYHFAILLPDRRELARAIARLFQLQYRNFPTDHIMTKTTYLDDPEGNGIEFYAESPEDGAFAIEGDTFAARRADGTPSDGREPLDVEALLGHLRPGDRLDQPMPDSTRVGHVHLHVADMDAAVDFYHGVVGFDVMGVARTIGAAFVSAGGYHHHVGLNTWQGIGAPPPPPDALGLDYFTVELPDGAELERLASRLRKAGITAGNGGGEILVRDPAQNRVRFVVGGV